MKKQKQHSMLLKKIQQQRLLNSQSLPENHNARFPESLKNTKKLGLSDVKAHEKKDHGWLKNEII